MSGVEEAVDEAVRVAAGFDLYDMSKVSNTCLKQNKAIHWYQHAADYGKRLSVHFDDFADDLCGRTSRHCLSHDPFDNRKRRTHAACFLKGHGANAYLKSFTSRRIHGHRKRKGTTVEQSQSNSECKDTMPHAINLDILHHP